MEPEGSLPYSQVPAKFPYPEPVRTSPYFQILLSEDPYGAPRLNVKFVGSIRNMFIQTGYFGSQ